MRIGAFEFNAPLPELHSPHAFAILRPWIDAGSAGRATISLLDSTFKAVEIAKLARPGIFFDFTRYRPIMRYVDDERQISIPNTHISYAVHPGDHDLVFIYMLEPHSFSEIYIKSIVQVLKALKIKRYCLLGSMYDMVPHTRPLAISGIADPAVMEQLLPLGVSTSNYEGPTTIAALISHEAQKQDIEIMTLIVHLPQYAHLEKDYNAHLRLMEVLCSLYDFKIDLTSLRKQAEKQYRELDQKLEEDPQLLHVVEYLESVYEARRGKSGEKTTKLSPEIEKFLREINTNFQ
jgi:proteasome assembly chaperone (PAC2) family protein